MLVLLLDSSLPSQRYGTTPFRHLDRTAIIAESEKKMTIFGQGSFIRPVNGVPHFKTSNPYKIMHVDRLTTHIEQINENNTKQFNNK